MDKISGNITKIGEYFFSLDTYTCLLPFNMRGTKFKSLLKAAKKSKALIVVYGEHAPSSIFNGQRFKVSRVLFDNNPTLI